MITAVRRGLERVLRDGPKHFVLGGWTGEAIRENRAALEWIERQLKIDNKRRNPRGSYRRSRR